MTELRSGEPAQVEEIAKQLAGLCLATGADVVATPDDTDSAIFGHILARELGAIRVLAREVEGLVEFVDEPPPGSRVLAYAPTFTSARVLIFRSLVMRSRCELIGYAALEDSPALQAADGAVFALERA